MFIGFFNNSAVGAYSLCTCKSSTSKTSVALGGITPPAPRRPYAYEGPQMSFAFSPRLICAEREARQAAQGRGPRRETYRGDALVPAANDLAETDAEFKGASAIARTVELAPIGELGGKWGGRRGGSR